MDDPLETQISDMRAVLSSLSSAAGKVRRDLSEAKETLRLRGKDPRRVSDHAVLRYLERVRGMNMDAVRIEINRLVDESVPFAKADGNWHAATGLVFILEGGSVVTVLDKERGEKYLGRRLINGERSETAPQLLTFAGREVNETQPN